MPTVQQGPSDFVQRIPIPEDCEEVEVKRRISVPGKPAVYVSAMELRKRRETAAERTAKGIAIAWVVMDNGGVPVDDTPHPVKLKTGVVKPNPRPVKKPKPVKIVKPKRVFNRQPVGARQHGGAPRCSFCGGGMAAEIGSIHARCQEAKDRIAGKK